MLPGEAGVGAGGGLPHQRGHRVGLRAERGGARAGARGRLRVPAGASLRLSLDPATAAVNITRVLILSFLYFVVLFYFGLVWLWFVLFGFRFDLFWFALAFGLASLSLLLGPLCSDFGISVRLAWGWFLVLLVMMALRFILDGLES